MRVKKADSLSAHWETEYRKCLSAVVSAANELPSIKPSGKFVVGVTAIFGNVVGAGPSVGYMDKNGKLFQVNVLGTNQKVLYQGTVSVPIGRKKK